MTNYFKERSDNKVLAKDLREQKVNYKWKFNWESIFVVVYIHFTGIYGLYLAFFYAKLWTILWSFSIFYIAAMLGTIAGSHRLWSHRSYKAKWPMKLILILFQAAAFQGPIYAWARDHRLHHKFMDTDADPYNARRGIFFSHIGWLLIHKHPEVLIKGATIDCKDLKQDSFIVFQRKWYTYLLMSWLILSTLISCWTWNETLLCAWHLAICMICLNLHMTFTINSIAHKWGTRPYNKSITPVNNTGVSFVTFGEGWHNYHHVFPWDYKVAETKNYTFNFATVFIDIFAFLNLAYDLKTANINIVKKYSLQNDRIISAEK
ncbi:Acyl-delta desaturase [Camponotus japonicus]